jgi:cytochrome b
VDTRADIAPTTPPPPTIRVWDPLVRAAHWSLVIAVVAAYATGDDGGKWHEALGYAAAEAIEDVHEALANGLVAAAAIHVAGVAWESLRHGENLARAMLDGRKRAPAPGDR